MLKNLTLSGRLLIGLLGLLAASHAREVGEPRRSPSAGRNLE